MAKKTKQSKTLPIYILNGPNLNLLGHREPEVYGYTTLAQIEKMCADRAAQHGLAIVFHQSNHEGEIVDQIQEARTSGSAVIINPAGYGHTSVAILDSLLAAYVPALSGYAIYVAFAVGILGRMYLPAFKEVVEELFAAGLVLFVLTLIVNIIARWFVRRGTRGMRAPEADADNTLSVYTPSTTAGQA